MPTANLLSDGLHFKHSAALFKRVTTNRGVHFTPFCSFLQTRQPPSSEQLARRPDCGAQSKPDTCWSWPVSMSCSCHSFPSCVSVVYMRISGLLNEIASSFKFRFHAWQVTQGPRYSADVGTTSMPSFLWVPSQSLRRGCELSALEDTNRSEVWSFISRAGILHIHLQTGALSGQCQPHARQWLLRGSMGHIFSARRFFFRLDRPRSVGHASAREYSRGFSHGYKKRSKLTGCQAES